MAIQPNQQYNAIQQALESGKRVVYHAPTNTFQVMSRSAAKELAKSKEADYITDLPGLKQKVEEFIKANGIDAQQKQILEDAFNGRATKLEKRFVIFGGDERDKAVTELKGFKTVIERAASQVSRIPAGVPPSTPGPTRHLGVALPGLTPAPTHPTTTTAPRPPTEEEAIFSTPQTTTITTTAPGSTPAAAPKPTPAPPEAPSAPVTSQVFSSAPPPPPPPGAGKGAVKPPKFANEPNEPVINKTDYRNKEQSVLEQEMQTIDVYVKAMEKVLGDIETDVNRHEQLKSQIASSNADYMLPGRTQLEGLKPKMEPLMNLFNSKQGGEIEIGNGAMRVYTDEEYNQEIAHRQHNPELKKVYDSKQKISEANKLSFIIPITYSNLKAQAARVGKKGDETYKLIDTATNKEIAPVRVIKSAAKLELQHEEGAGYIRFDQAKGPLKLVKETQKEDGSIAQEITSREQEKTLLETKKCGDIPFTEFKSKLTSKQNSLNSWKTAYSNRQKVILGQLPKETATAAPKDESWDLITQQRPELVDQASKWEKVDGKFKQNLEIAPETNIINALISGNVKSL